ncbi:MAG: dihydropteroate synthase, partial [Patescibacteria group bacterium]
ADIIDIGAESTRPDSSAVSRDEELRRLKPIIEHIAKTRLYEKIDFSIDTYKAEVAAYALDHGFKIVNDVTALRGDSTMSDMLASRKPFVALMYSKDACAQTTRRLVEYKDVVGHIKIFLRERINILTAKGFPKENIIVDPGMGLFISSNPKYSFDVIDRLSELKELGCPILVGISRKTFLGATPDESDHASCAWSMQAIHNGASIVRMHNVQMMHDVLSHKLLVR